MFHVSKYFGEYHIADSRHILKKYGAGLRVKLSYDAIHFRPEMAVILRAAFVPGVGIGLAGRPAANNVNCCEVSPSYVSDTGAELICCWMGSSECCDSVWVIISLPFHIKARPHCGQPKSIDASK